MWLTRLCFFVVCLVREKDVSFDKLVSGLLRSKGFLWLASTDRAALYFSHAGTPNLEGI